MTMFGREKSSATSTHTSPSGENEMEWSTEDEIQLFSALEGLKPVGVNKHFYMACIVTRLSKRLNRDISAEAVWAHLRTMYNLEALDEMEPLPFPNDEKEFSLPEEFALFLSKKKSESEEHRISSGESSGPPSIIALATDNTGKEKYTSFSKSITNSPQLKDTDKKSNNKLNVEVPKRAQKRTRNSTSLDISSSPSTTPTPSPVHVNKRRRI